MTDCKGRFIVTIGFFGQRPWKGRRNILHSDMGHCLFLRFSRLGDLFISFFSGQRIQISPDPAMQKSRWWHVRSHRVHFRSWQISQRHGKVLVQRHGLGWTRWIRKLLQWVLERIVIGTKIRFGRGPLAKGTAIWAVKKWIKWRVSIGTKIWLRMNQLFMKTSKVSSVKQGQVMANMCASLTKIERLNVFNEWAFILMSEILTWVSYSFSIGTKIWLGIYFLIWKKIRNMTDQRPDGSTKQRVASRARDCKQASI